MDGVPRMHRSPGSGKGSDRERWLPFPVAAGDRAACPATGNGLRYRIEALFVYSIRYFGCVVEMPDPAS